MNKTIASSTGGSIKYSDRGLVHTASTGAYSGRIAEMGMECMVVDAPKRGRGRPKAVTSANGSYDFSAFVSPVKLAKFTGNVTVVKAKV